MAQNMYTGGPDTMSDMDRQALLAQMAQQNAQTYQYGNQPGVEPAYATRMEPQPAAPTSANRPGGSYGLEGYDAQKLASGHDSPKYQIGRTISQFDPSKGVTDEVIAALNALGIGTFSGGKDKIRVSGNVDPRFQGVTEFDIVRGLTGQDNPAWQFVGRNGPAAQPTRSPMGYAPSSGVGAIAPLMPTDASAYQTLERRIQEILGGVQTFDRDALLSQLMR